MKKMRTLLALTILWTCDKNVNRLMLQSHEGKQLLDTVAQITVNVHNELVIWLHLLLCRTVASW